MTDIDRISVAVTTEVLGVAQAYMLPQDHSDYHNRVRAIAWGLVVGGVAILEANFGGESRGIAEAHRLVDALEPMRAERWLNNGR